jgi:hypothetical protein
VDIKKPTAVGIPLERRAELLARLRGARGTAPDRPAPRGSREAPATSQQRTLWFLDRMDPGRATYNLPIYLRLRGEVDAGGLRRALADVVARHEALRAHLTERDGRIVQPVAPAVPVTLPILDTAAPDDALRRARELGGLPFDLASAPLWRARLLRIGSLDHIFVFAVHHAVFDGASIRVFWRDLAECYRAAVTGTTADLPPLAFQYPDFACWQEEHLAGPAGARLKEYWRRRLADLVETPLLTDYPRPTELSSEGAVATKSVNPRLAAAAAEYARSVSTTPYSVYLAAFWVLLDRHRAQPGSEIVVGSPSAGRRFAELDDVVGFFVTMLVLRGDLGGDPTFAELVERAGSTAREALAHDGLPLEQIVQIAAPDRDPSRSPLFQVSFSVGAEAYFAPLHGDVTVEQIHMGHQVARLDMSWVMSLSAQTLAVVEYNTALYTAGTVDDMLTEFSDLLASLLAHPARPIPREDAGIRVARRRPQAGPLRSKAETSGLDNVSPGFPRPATETERVLAEEIFAVALGRLPSGTDENFFQAGGASLQAAQAISMVRDRFGVDVRVADFFRTPTVAGLAAVIERRRTVGLDDGSLLAFVEALSDDDVIRLLAAG